MMLRSGDLAYYMTDHAFIPCKVLSIGKARGSCLLEDYLVLINFTAHRAGYCRGRRLAVGGHKVVPRGALYYRDGMLRIKPYQMIAGATVCEHAQTARRA